MTEWLDVDLSVLAHCFSLFTGVDLPLSNRGITPGSHVACVSVIFGSICFCACQGSLSHTVIAMLIS